MGDNREVSSDFFPGFVVGVLVIVAMVAVRECSTTPTFDEDNRMAATCHAQLKTATASDSLRVFRVQPKCLP